LNSDSALFPLIGRVRQTRTSGLSKAGLTTSSNRGVFRERGRRTLLIERLAPWKSLFK